MYGPPEGQVVLGGFSQGGMMAYRNALSSPGEVRGDRRPEFHARQWA